MSAHQSDPLHGITLENILVYLVDKYGWEDMSRRIRVNCFAKDPGIRSSLVFLRKTPWARKKVEGLYIETVTRKQFVV
ncbi:MAG: VF530 family protein [Candidatus Omnitrophota bacterium]